MLHLQCASGVTRVSQVDWRALWDSAAGVASTGKMEHVHLLDRNAFGDATGLVERSMQAS